LRGHVLTVEELKTGRLFPLHTPPVSRVQIVLRFLASDPDNDQITRKKRARDGPKLSELSGDLDY